MKFKTGLTTLGSVFTLGVLMLLLVSTLALCSIARSLSVIKTQMTKESLYEDIKKIRQNADDVVESMGFRIAK